MSYTSASQLEGSGIPPLPASLIGRTVSTIAGVGTAQAGGAAIPAGVTTVVGTTTTGQTAFVLPLATPIGDAVEFINSTATAALLYPDLGSGINAAGTNASVSLAQNRGIVAIRTGLLQWWCILGAAS